MYLPTLDMLTAANLQLEVCVERSSDGVAAVAAGATRVELNTALSLDGLTARVADCQRFKLESATTLVAMVRPHAHGFYYTQAELLTALRSGQELLDAGVDGLVFGGLDERSQKIDIESLTAMRKLCGERPLIFHRAFDLIDDQFLGLEQLIDQGVRRVLTSGDAANAWQGAGRLQALQERAEGRIEILPGGGVSAMNAIEILQRTGCHQLHGSFRATSASDGQPDLQAIRKTREAMDAWAR